MGGQAENEDAFGACLGAGDFDGNGREDLAIGSPGETIGTEDAAGAANVLYATSGGVLTGAASQYWQLDMLGSDEDFVIERIDQFANALVGKDMNLDGRDDLLIAVRGKWNESGESVLVRGSQQGLTATGALLLNEVTEDNSYWGRTVL